MDFSLLCLLCDVYVAASATGWSQLQGSPTGSVCQSICNIDTSTTRRPGPDLGCCFT